MSLNDLILEKLATTEAVELEENYDEVSMAVRQLHFIQYAAEEIADYLEMRGDMDEWYQNKLATTHSMMQSLYAYSAGDQRMTDYGDYAEEATFKEFFSRTKKSGKKVMLKKGQKVVIPKSVHPFLSKRYGGVQGIIQGFDGDNDKFVLVKFDPKKVKHQGDDKMWFDATDLVKEEVDLDESTMRDRQVVRAMRIAKDMGGNHTGAVRAIEKLKKGLSDHPKVRDALRMANESVDLEENKIFFVKVGDGRDSMTVKTKAANKSDALKKLRSQYPKDKISLDRNQKQGEPAGTFESVDLEERNAGQSATGYDIYHDTYSAAMQHAYAHAEKKHKVKVDMDSVHDKVAMGPKKPSTGKTNSFILPTNTKKNLHVQVYNTGKKYELNMYVEEVELDENSNMAAIKKLLGGARPIDLERASDAIRAYSKKSGGSDKKDFDLAADYLDGMSRLNDLRKIADLKKRLTMDVGLLDTDVRDKINSMLPKGLTESVDINENFEQMLSERQVKQVPMPRAEFDKLKKGSIVDIDWDGAMSAGAGVFRVVSKSKSKKYDVEKVKLQPTDRKGGVPFYLYSRKGGDATLAIGDMGAIMTKSKIVKEQVKFSDYLEEKAVSQAQQKLMGMALAYKRGEMDDASDEVKKVADSMSEKDLEDFAKTKHKGLPAKVED